MVLVECMLRKVAALLEVKNGTHQMLIVMTSYSHDCQPRNHFNDMSWKVTCFITKYGCYVIGKHIVRKVRDRAIMSNFLMISAIFLN
jgi:hypothetical protein